MLSDSWLTNQCRCYIRKGPVATIVTGVSLVIALLIITSDAGIATA